jgi:hypothetical protein
MKNLLVKGYFQGVSCDLFPLFDSAVAQRTNF